MIELVFLKILVKRFSKSDKNWGHSDFLFKLFYLVFIHFLFLMGNYWFLSRGWILFMASCQKLWLQSLAPTMMYVCACMLGWMWLEELSYLAILVFRRWSKTLHNTPPRQLQLTHIVRLCIKPPKWEVYDLWVRSKKHIYVT